MANREQSKIMTKKHMARVERERRQNRWIVISASIVLFAVVALIGYGVLDQTVLQYNKPVIKVGDDVITVREFQKQVSLARAQKIMEYNFYSQFAQMYGADQFADTLTSLETSLGNPTMIGSEVIQNLTDDLLIRQEATKLGITVTSEEIEQRMREMYRYYPAGTPTPSLTPTTYATPTYNPTQLFWQATRPEPTATETATPEFTATPELTATIDLTPSATLEPTATITPTVEVTATLEPTATPTEMPATATATATPEPTATPYTLEGYMESLANYLEPYKSFGYLQDDYRRTVESIILREKLSEYLAGDAKHETEEVWARHILVENEDDMVAILAKLKAGEDFYDLAAEYSMDESNKNQGGDLGWFGRGQMVTEFEDAAFALKVGEISEPVMTSYGWHIIQLLGKRTKPLSDYEWKSQLDTYVTDFLSALKAERTDIETFNIWMDVVPSEPSLGNFPPPTQ
jgi:peptidyl-prolyl cis-trans isomerase D